MNLSSKIFCLILVLLLPTKINALGFSFGTKFFNYGNGAINLDNVTYVTPSWDYNYVYQGNENFADYSEVPDTQTIKGRVAELFDASYFNSVEYYFFKNSSKIMFDNFTLTVLSESMFLKMPNCSEITTRSDLLTFIEGVAEKLEDFDTFDKVELCERLRKKQVFITSEKIKELEKGLMDTADTYKKIVEQFFNRRKGHGTLTFLNGDKWVGAWENNKLNGYAITYYADGGINQEGIFKDNEFLYAEKRSKPVITPSTDSDLDTLKDICEEIGFTPKTVDFGNCVLKLMDKD